MIPLSDEELLALPLAVCRRSVAELPVITASPTYLATMVMLVMASGVLKILPELRIRSLHRNGIASLSRLPQGIKITLKARNPARLRLAACG